MLDKYKDMKSSNQSTKMENVVFKDIHELRDMMNEIIGHEQDAYFRMLRYTINGIGWKYIDGYKDNGICVDDIGNRLYFDNEQGKYDIEK